MQLQAALQKALVKVSRDDQMFFLGWMCCSDLVFWTRLCCIVKALFFSEQLRNLVGPKVWFAQHPLSQCSLVLALCLGPVCDISDLRHLFARTELALVLHLCAEEAGV